jgi:hypothetical protein
MQKKIKKRNKEYYDRNKEFILKGYMRKKLTNMEKVEVNYCTHQQKKPTKIKEKKIAVN